VRCKTAAAKIVGQILAKKYLAGKKMDNTSPAYSPQDSHYDLQRGYMKLSKRTQSSEKVGGLSKEFA